MNAWATCWYIFEVATASSFRDFPKKSFRDDGGGAVAAYIDGTIKRKRIRVSLFFYMADQFCAVFMRSESG